MKRPSHYQPPQYSHGTSMVEVLVAMVVMVVGLLGAAGMQVNSMRSHHDAYERTIALHQVSDMADRMRANMPGVAAGFYLNNNPLPQNCNGVAANCTAQEMANFDLDNWNINNARLLPGAVGAVAPPDANGLFAITLTWTGRGGGNETVAMSVRP